MCLFSLFFFFPHYEAIHVHCGNLENTEKYKEENKNHPDLITERKLLLTFVLYPPRIFSYA